MTYVGRGSPGQFLSWTGTKHAWADPIGMSPVSFALRSWWDISNAPANGALVTTQWPVFAGNQGIPLVAGSTVVRGGTPFPDGSVGVTSGFKSLGFVWADTANTPWNTVDGSYSMFTVTRASAVGGGIAGAMGPLGNPNSGNTNIMAYCVSDNGLRSQKNSFGGNFEILANAAFAARDDMAMVIVSTYTAARIDTTVLWDDGAITTGGGADATTIANAGGYTLNGKGDPAFPTIWTKPTVSAGVIGQGLTAGERLALARNMAARFNLSGF